MENEKREKAKPAPNTSNRKRTIGWLEKKAKRAEEDGDLEQSIALLEQAIALADGQGNLPLQAKLLNQLALVQKRVGNFNEAKETLQQALDLLKDTPYSLELAQLYNNFGFVERDAGNLRIAEQYHKMAMQIFESIGNSFQIARTLTELGIVYKDLGQLTKARTCLEQALMQLDYQQVSRERAHTLVSLGLTLLMLNDLRGARRSYLKALADYRRVVDRENEALVLHNLGQLYDNQAKTEREFQLALTNYRKALAINEAIKNPLGIAEDLGSMAALYQVIGDVDAARQMHEQALSMYEKIGFREGQVHTLVDLGILARDTHDFGQAKKHMTEALLLAQQIGNPRSIHDVFVNRGDVYVMAGQFQEASQDYENAVATIETIRANLLLESEALGYFDEARLEGYDRLVALYALSLKKPTVAYFYMEQAKAREFLRRLRLSELLHSQQTPKELLHREAHLLAQLHQANSALAAPNAPDPLTTLREYEAVESKLQVVWTEIEPFDSEYVSLRRGEQVSWAATKECLRFA